MTTLDVRPCGAFARSGQEEGQEDAVSGLTDAGRAAWCLMVPRTTCRREGLPRTTGLWQQQGWLADSAERPLLRGGWAKTTLVLPWFWAGARNAPFGRTFSRPGRQVESGFVRGTG